MFNWQGRASKADMAGLQSSLNIQVTLTDQVEFQVALGEHFELPNGIQLALEGQLEGPGGVQVALGGQFARAKWCLMAPKWRSVATLKGQAQSKWCLEASSTCQVAPKWRRVPLGVRLGRPT